MYQEKLMCQDNQDHQNLQFKKVVAVSEFPYHCHATAIEGTCEIRPLDYDQLKLFSDNLR